MDAEVPRAQRGFELLDIHCSTCGAPAAYDIVKHTYACAYCGSMTGIDEALEQKRGFRALLKQELRSDEDAFHAVKCTCSYGAL